MERNKSGKLELRLEGQIEKTYGNHLYFPLYLNSYEDALRSIFLRILWNDDNKNFRQNAFTYIKRDKESNVISFIGARGSGKTTAMMEFSQIVSKLNQDGERRWWIEKVFTESLLKERLMYNKVFFKVLEPIDASCLEEKEDLFEMVMATLFREYEKAAEDAQFADGDRHRCREIQILFDEIITGYNVIKRARNQLLESNPDSMQYHEQCYGYIAKVYRKIISLLKEEENEYRSKGIPFNYAENFASCPFVQAFLNAETDLHPDFREDLGAIIYNTMQPSSLRRHEHPEEE